MPEENTGEVQGEIQPEVLEKPIVEDTKQSDAQNDETQETKPEQEEAPRDEKGKFRAVQPRINELTKKVHNAKREAAYWKAQATSSGTTAEKPKAEDYTDYTDYVEALSDYKAGEKVSEALSRRDQDQVSQAQAEVNDLKQQVWRERTDSFRAEIKDFDAALSAADTLLPVYVIEALLESEKGPQLAYHLAKNPGAAKQLAVMSQREADREIGRLEAKLEKPRLVTKPVSNAPEPITSTRGGTAGNVSGDPTKMSPTQFASWAQKQGSKWIR